MALLYSKNELYHRIQHWVIPEKIHPPSPRRRRGGLIAQEIQVGGGSEPKNSSSGVTFNFNLD